MRLVCWNVSTAYDPRASISISMLHGWWHAWCTLRCMCTIRNRSEQMEIGPNKWKSVRIHGNRSKQMEIDPNSWKSVRTNGNRSEQMEIDPNQRKSIRLPNPIHLLLKSNPIFCYQKNVVGSNQIDHLSGRDNEAMKQH
jgi:hypothetical protein